MGLSRQSNRVGHRRIARHRRRHLQTLGKAGATVVGTATTTPGRQELSAIDAAGLKGRGCVPECDRRGTVRRRALHIEKVLAQSAYW